MAGTIRFDPDDGYRVPSHRTRKRQARPVKTGNTRREEFEHGIDSSVHDVPGPLSDPDYTYYAAKYACVS